jgi:hypothetical protein
MTSAIKAVPPIKQSNLSERELRDDELHQKWYEAAHAIADRELARLNTACRGFCHTCRC